MKPQTPEQKARRLANAKKWKLANIEKVRLAARLRVKAKRRANPEPSRISNRAWKKANPEKVRASHTAWCRANRERSRKWKKTEAGKASMVASEQKRRAARKSANGSVTKDQLLALRARQTKCFYCGKKSKKLTYDHIQPLARGGKHEIQNLIMACGVCNSKKQAKDPEHFASEVGLLFI